MFENFNALCTNYRNAKEWCKNHKATMLKATEKGFFSLTQMAKIIICHTRICKTERTQVNKMSTTKKELSLESMYLVQKAHKERKERKREMEFEDRFENAYTEWKYKLADKLYEFLRTCGVMIAWFAIMLIIFWAGIRQM